MSCASQVFGCAPQLLFLNHEPRNARLCCFYVREMRAARYDEAQCDYNNRFADIIEIHQKQEPRERLGSRARICASKP